MTYDFKPAKAGGQAPRLSKEEYSDDDDYYTFHCVKSDSE